MKPYRQTSRLLLVWLAAACLNVTGCDDGGKDLAHVSGKVLLDGRPMTTGRVLAVNDAGKTATGEIRSDGGFELTRPQEGDGIPAGKYRVAVFAFEGGVDLVANPEAPRKLLVPKKYAQAETSGLTFEATAGEAKEVTFELTSSK